METFAARLRRIRESRGLSVNELGRRMGKSPSYVSLVENGKRLVDKLPNYDDLQAMARALDVSIDELVGAIEPRRIIEAPAPYLSDAALLTKVGAIPASEDAYTGEEFDGSARTGRNNLIPQNYDDMRPRRQTTKRKPKAEPTIFKLRISGTCMYPTLRDGEIIWFDTTLSREPGHIVLAVKDEHEAHIKWLVERDGQRWLQADDGWCTPVDEHWRIAARAFDAQRRLP